MNILRGWFGEKLTTFNMWLSLDAKVYRRFHDVIIPGKNGTTQIDHLLISPYGVFIVETKNIKGWIFGSENQSKWTQSLYGKMYSFQNPTHQTFRQKKVLSEYLNINESKIQIVIYFVGDCKFKTNLPTNVINSGLSRYIMQFDNRILSSDEINHSVIKLQKHIAESSLTTKDHIQSLRERHSSTTVCPKCGANLVKRTTKNGPNAGSIFFGCDNYPRCRFTQNL